MGTRQTVVVCVVATLLCGCGRQLQPASARANPTPIPWVSSTPASMLLPTPTATPIPAGTPACRTSDLKAIFNGISALTGGQLAGSVLFGNQTATACVLQGLPAVQLFSSSGQAFPVSTSLARDVPSGPVLVLPGTSDLQAHVARDGVALVEIDWATHDGAGNACVPAPYHASVVGIILPGATSSIKVSVGADPMNPEGDIAPCYSRVSVSPFQALPGPYVAPTPDPLAALAIHIDAPSEVKAGSSLTYTITLQNTGSTPVAFTRGCPVYGEWAGNDSGGFGKAFYILNCAPVGSIQPNGRVSFAMKMAVPSGTTPGRYTLAWTIVGTTDLDMPAGKTLITVAG